MRSSHAVCLTLPLLVACGSGGGAGRITGRVSVEGGTATGLAVEALGPTPSAAAVDESGSFTLEGLRDGWYVVRATLSAAEVPTQEAVVRVDRGAGDREPMLGFKLAKGKVTGKVVFSDASAATGLPVSLAGPVARSAVTDVMGAFAIESLPSGAYVLTVEAANTRERRQTVTFSLDAATSAVMLADLPFTATGTVAGTVKDSTMMPLPGVEVTVPGTSVRALTDGLGAFELLEVPAGLRSVIATRTGAVTLSAKADVTVVRGVNPAVMLTLMASTPPTGTVRGGVTFFHSGTPELITVSALGSNASTRVSSLGQYSLDVAAGEWDIVAEAPHYPRMLLGRVLVREGSSQLLPPAHLTLYQRFPPEPGLLGVTTGGLASEGDWLLLQTTGARGNQWWVVNGKTLSRRLYHEAGLGGGSPAVSSILSRTGQHLAYFASSGLYLVNLTTGAQVAFTRSLGQHDFSTDETVYFGVESGGLMRYTMASATRRDFTGTGVVKLTRDRWLVVNATAREVTLVTPTAEFLVFSNTDAVAYSPFPYAFSGCVMGMGCTIRLLPGSATAAVTLQGTYSSAASFYSTAAMESSAEYAPFNTTTLQRLVKLTDGTAVDLPANTTRVDFNETGTRLFYLSGSPGNTNLREEAVPASGAGTPLATLTAGVGAQWISASRAVVFDDAPGAGRRLEVRNGSLTVDSNYVTGSGGFALPLAHWARSSDMKRAGVVADASVRTLDINYPGTGVSAAGGYEGVGLPGRWGALSDNTLSGFKGTFVLDGPKDELRLLTQLKVNVQATLPRTWVAAHAFSSETGVVTFATDQFLGLGEPGLTTQVLLQRPGGSWGVVLDGSSTPRVALADLPYP